MGGAGQKKHILYGREKKRFREAKGVPQGRRKTSVAASLKTGRQDVWKFRRKKGSAAVVEISKKSNILPSERKESRAAREMRRT